MKQMEKTMQPTEQKNKATLKESSHDEATTPSASKHGAVKPSNKTNKFYMVFAGLLSIFILGVFAQPYALNGLQSLGLLEKPAEKEDFSVRLTNDLQKRDAKITALEQKNIAQNETLQQYQSQLAALDLKLDSLAARNGDTIATDAFIAEISTIKRDLNSGKANTQILLKRLEDIETMVTNLGPNNAGNAQSVQAIFALHTLYRTIESGEDFSRALPIITAYFQASNTSSPAIEDSLSVLKANAAGVVTKAELSKNFKTVIPALYATTNDDDPSISWWKSFFTLRKTNAEPNTLDAKIKAIEDALNSNALDAALRAVLNLSEAQQNQITLWHDQLKRHVTVIEALDVLMHSMVEMEALS